MGFSIDVVADILKFPHPLFPKYKNQCPIGQRFEIPLTKGVPTTYNFDIELPKDNDYELQGISFSQTGYSDKDCYSLLLDDTYIVKDIYAKELGQSKEIRPIVKINSNKNKLKFVYNNTSGTAKSIYLDLELTCRLAIKV